MLKPLLSAGLCCLTIYFSVPLDFVLDINAYDITDVNGIALQTQKINDISSNHHHPDTVSQLHSTSIVQATGCFYLIQFLDG
jgi:hypothetical protein